MSAFRRSKLVFFYSKFVAKKFFQVIWRVQQWFLQAAYRAGVNQSVQLIINVRIHIVWSYKKKTLNAK